MKTIPDLSNLKDYSSYGFDGEKPDISLCEYSLSKLSPDLLVAVTRLFFPEFVEYDGGVFLADRFSASLYNDWKRGRFKNDLPSVERMINHVHLVETLGNGFHGLNKQNVHYIGEVLVQTWKCALSYEFPDRSFELEGKIDEAGRSPDTGDFIITFWQNPKS